MQPLPFGFYPFWFWNDKITDAEIERQVSEMAAQGVRGFFIHSRQGLYDPPYLSEEFFDRVGAAIRSAKKYDLVVHLYDEYPYPSGVAGGLAIMGEPALWATELIHQSWDLEGGPVRLELPPGKILSLQAFPLSSGQPDWEHPLDLEPAVGAVLVEDSYQETGLTRYNQKRFFSGRPHPVLQTCLSGGRWRVYASLQGVVDNHKYWDHFADVLQPQAVLRFIDLTHKRYHQRFADEFGKTVRWIFTDEVVPGWSAGLPVAFQEEYGYSLLALLPALADPTHPRHQQVTFDLHRLKLKLFSRTFEEPISGWCREHGLAYAAEKPSLRFSQLRFQDIPGCEPGHVKAGAVLDLLQPSLRGNAKATASAAYFYGKDGALDECYHSLGWSATLEDIRWMADAQLLLGIRYLVPHGFFYSTHNLRKHDAPPTLFFQAPYWPLFHLLSRRVDRIGRLFEGTYINARMVIIDPTAGLPTHQDRSEYERLLHLLMGQHLDFHIADTDVLQAGKLENARVILRDLSVQIVLVPPMQVIEKPLAEWLERFQQAGGLVVRCPAGFQAPKILSEIRLAIQPGLSLIKDGQENPALWCVERRHANRSLWLALNISGEIQEVELNAPEPLHEIALEEEGSLRLEQRGGKTWRTFQPFEACLLESGSASPTVSPNPVVSITPGSPLGVIPHAANLARLNDWLLTLDGPDGKSQQSALVSAVPLANQLEQGQFMITPKVKRVFGNPPHLDWPELKLNYTCDFQNRFDGEVELVMEPGSIGGEWSIQVNDFISLGQADFHLVQAHVHGSLGAAITPYLRPGSNRITVQVTTSHPDGGLINPLYLAGFFGVSLQPLSLVPRATTGLFEAYRQNLLPYYAGIIDYPFQVEIERLPESATVPIQLVAPQPFHEAAEICLNGGSWHALPWGLYPFVVDRNELRIGTNSITLRIYTTLIRSFEGQEFDYQNHHYVQI